MLLAYLVPQVWSCGWGRGQPGEQLCSSDRSADAVAEGAGEQRSKRSLCLPGATEGRGPQEAGARGRGPGGNHEGRAQEVRGNARTGE